MRTYRIYILILLIFLINTILLTKKPFTDTAIILDVSYNQLSKETQKQVDCLADNIYYEAGFEPTDGKVAVALVTLNRMYHPKYPKDICGVVKQRTSSVCQFSWFCNTVSIKNKDAYEQAKEVAVYVYANYENLKDITRGAMFYHADYVNPRWKLEKTTVIGRHIFYKEIGKIK